MGARGDQVDVELLGLLLGAEAAWTAEALGRARGISPVAAAERVERLRQAGCAIEDHPQRGLRLVRAGLGCWADYIEASRLVGKRLGRRVSVYRQTTSTQEVARRLVGNGTVPEAGRVIVADHQTGGRGRLGRRWLDEPGAALLLTVIADRRGAPVDRLMLGSCCALAEAVESLTGLSVRVRWPNDVLIGEAKLAGTLVEAVGGAALIGIGVNVSGEPDAAELTGGMQTVATSLARHGAAVDRLRLLDVLLDRLEAALYTASDERLHAAWKSRAALLGERVTVRNGERELTGRVVDLDPAHGLMLHVDGGAVVTLAAGTTSLVGGEL